ncbi:MAG TPA: EAL domain-containing protein [Mobilitalea sp.]|nr:EAL domain-containing protein [Mobilitalea sp.]
MKSVKTKGILYSLSLILLAVLPLGFGAYFSFKKILVSEVNQAIVRVAEETADHLNSYIEQFIAPLVGISQNEQIISMDWPLQRDILNAQINPYYLSVAVLDSKGNAHYVDETTLDLSDREYITEALSGNISFSEVITSRKTGEHVIMVAVPIFKDKVIQGALIARLNDDFLSDFALTRGYGENGRAYIISDNGAFISRPQQEKDDTTLNIYEAAQKDNSFDAFAEFVQNSNSKQSGFGSYAFQDEQILMGYASVHETNWKIYVGTVEDEALDNLIHLAKTFIGLIIVSLIFCSLLAFYVVRRFVKPIVELSSLFAKGALGNLTVRFMPKSNDELGSLGQSFNRMMDSIKTLTQYDPLTSLLNQYVLEKEVETLVNSEGSQKLSLIMVAIDKFSSINNSFGYAMGDAVLCEVAVRIAKCTPGDYQLYRYKGDEFIVMGTKFPVGDELYTISQKILAALHERYQIKGKNISIDVSIGIFLWTEETRAEEPLKAVTNAMNYARYIGSNQIQKYNPLIHANLLGIRQLQTDIISGISEEQFSLVYQPMVDLENRKVVQIEALIRWKHPKRGLLYPDQFIDLAEQNGTITNIDIWVMNNVCKQIKAWKDIRQKPFIISINVSAKTFEDKKFVPIIVDIMNQYGIEPSLIQLEITERMAIKNVDESIMKLNELRTMGIRIAIDDFGIGYSSLSYIIRLPIDSIKIDKSFIQNMNKSKEARALVSTIISLCKTLKYNVIAEGIESIEELDYLKENECDVGQGYYFSKPVSIEELVKNCQAG